VTRRRNAPQKHQAKQRAVLETAVAFHRAGKLDDAAAAYRKILTADPTQADVPSLLG